MPITVWAAIALAWLGMLVVTVQTHGEHVLIVPAWGTLVALLGISILVDRRRVFRAYGRGMRASARRMKFASSS